MMLVLLLELLLAYVVMSFHRIDCWKALWVLHTMHCIKRMHMQSFDLKSEDSSFNFFPICFAIRRCFICVGLYMYLWLLQKYRNATIFLCVSSVEASWRMRAHNWKFFEQCEKVMVIPQKIFINSTEMKQIKTTGRGMNVKWEIWRSIRSLLTLSLPNYFFVLTVTHKMTFGPNNNGFYKFFFVHFIHAKQRNVILLQYVCICLIEKKTPKSSEMSVFSCFYPIRIFCASKYCKYAFEAFFWLGLAKWPSVL